MPAAPPLRRERRICSSLSPPAAALVFPSSPAPRQVFTLGWNSEGKRLASGSVDMTVRINRVDEACGVRCGGPRPAARATAALCRGC